MRNIKRFSKFDLLTQTAGLPRENRIDQDKMQLTFGTVINTYRKCLQRVTRIADI